MGATRRASSGGVTSHTLLTNRDAANQHPASSLTPNTSAFDKILSASDDTVQKALDTIDEHTHAHDDTTGITATNHHDNSNDPTEDEKEALAGTGTPSITNPYVTLDSLSDYAKVVNGITNPELLSLTYDASTRKLTVVNTGATVTINGVTVTPEDEVTTAHADATSPYFFYYESGNTKLTVSSTPWDILTNAPARFEYYNADLVDSIGLYEKHPTIFSAMEHYTEHFFHGTKFLGGCALTDYTLNPVSPTDADNQLAVATGIYADEDIVHNMLALLSGGPYTVMYRFGTTDWRWDKTPTVPFISGTYAQYNLNSGGTWGLQDITNNEYYNIWLIGTYNARGGTDIFVVTGQAVYSTLAGAVLETFQNSINWGTDIPFAEFCPLYKITLRGGSAYTNTGKARFAAVESLRYIKGGSVAISGTPTSHQSLSDRDAEDVHPVTSLYGTLEDNMMVIDTDLNVSEFLVAEQRLVGRVTSGHVDDLTDDQIHSIIFGTSNPISQDINLANTFDLLSNEPFGSDLGYDYSPFGDVNAGRVFARHTVLPGASYIYMDHDGDDGIIDTTGDLVLRATESPGEVRLESILDAQANIRLGNTFDLICATAFGSDIFSAATPGGDIHGSIFSSYAVAGSAKFYKYRCNGTWAVPTKVLSGQNVFSDNAYAYHGGDAFAQIANISVWAREDMDTANDLGCAMSFYVTDVNDAAVSEYMRLDGNGETIDCYRNVELANGIDLTCATAGGSDIGSGSYPMGEVTSQRFTLREDAATTPYFLHYAWGANPTYNGYKYNGTPSVPTKVLSGNNLFDFQFYGYHGGGTIGLSAGIYVQAAEDFDTINDLGSRMRFYVTDLNDGSVSEYLRLDGNGEYIIAYKDVNLANGVDILTAAAGGSSIASFSYPFQDIYTRRLFAVQQAASPLIREYCYSATTTHYGDFGCVKGTGTVAAPAAVGNAHYIGAWSCYGYVDATTIAYGAGLIGLTTEAWSAGNNGCEIQVWTCPDGSGAEREVATFRQDGIFESKFGVELANGADLTCATAGGSELFTEATPCGGIYGRSFYMWDNSWVACILGSWNASTYPYLSLRRGRGTKASAKAVENGDIIGLLQYQAFDDVDYYGNAKLFVEATEDHSAGNHGTKMYVQTTANGEAAARTVATFKEDGLLDVLTGYSVGGAAGWSGSFTNGDGDTVTVVGGIITNVA